MQRLLLVISLHCFFIATLKAEIGVLVGAKAGFDIAHLRKFEPITDYKKTVKLGSDIAGMLRLDFNKYISLQTEIEFIQKGQAWKNKTDTAKYYGKWVMNYVQFPILAVGRFGNDKVKAIVQLGPYVSYWTGGYTQSSVTIDKQSKNAITNKYEFTTNNMRVDVGWITGIGANIKVGKGWIDVGARHQLGFLSINKKNTGLPKLYNCGVSFYVGYLYTIK